MKDTHRFYLIGFLALLSMLVVMACDRNVDIVFMDFEGDDYGDWKVTGISFGTAPASGSLENQQPVTEFKGNGFANSFHGGGKAQGTLTSPEF